MINYWKKNKEYYLAQDYSSNYFVGNGWNPFEKIHFLDYEIYSDDVDGGLELIDSDDDEISSEGEMPEDIFEENEGDKPAWNTNPERFKFSNMFDLTTNVTKKFEVNLAGK